MNEFLDTISWIIVGLQFSVLGCFLYLFKERRRELIFGGSKSLKNKSDHELHSCFLTTITSVFCLLLFEHLLNSLLDLQIDKMVRRQIFYFISACGNASFIIALTLLHAIRGCTFSPVARYSCYLFLIGMLLKTAQLLMAGYLDITSFKHYYSILVLITIVLQFFLIAKYPFDVIMKKKYAKEC
ncbi:hypothetical protein N483_18845 [Pseudoalteromonas luteoviolacea NCIMB 1944]|uniref:Uncharacterized protein n=1 Tax=Pseudoalteromonas luteoviolacea (strain 2ta16) TaxID=1353533 RepID=V4HKP1_PSEL2|nr:hypothetical protein PL2TA16_01995 [Pseudoalteromonas luteoviolacea 2ta16]KZN39915.1 hypothetical protein N483_18845 [Pseudoalteromonas luteoviolacea NCIMB 1944]